MDYQLNNDCPIQSEAKDILGRNYFAKDLANIIVDYTKNRKDRDGLVIGLEGEWGSGKTSLLNLVRNQLIKHVGFETREFNSWMTTDTDGLIKEFFNIIVDFYQSNHKVKESMKKYAKNFLLKTTKGLTINIGIPSVAGVKADVGKSIAGLFEEKPLIKQKSDLNEKLQAEADDKWLIVFVDDIDRLSYQEISILFQLIKNIADFPGIIYVLAYDRDIVINALENIQPGKGADYLQKVVQVTYDVPMLRREELGDYFISLIENENLQKSESTFDQSHFQTIYYFSLYYFFDNLRDCKRLANAFWIKYSLCGMNCDFADLLAITALEVFEPRVYDMIRHHKSYMIAQNMFGMGLTDNDKKDLEPFFIKLKNAFSPKRRRYADELIKNMFPRFYSLATKDKLAAFSTSVNFEIANGDNFDRYFALKIRDDEISIEHIVHFFKQKQTVEDIEKQLDFWQEHQQIGYFFEQGIRLFQNLNKHDIQFDDAQVLAYLEALSHIVLPPQYNMFKRESTWMRTVFVDTLIRKVVFEYNLKNAEGRKEHLLKQIVQDSQINCSILFYVLRGISDGYPWPFENVDRSPLPQTVSDATFEFCSRLLLKRIQNEVIDKKFFDEPYIYDIIRFWQYKDINSYSKFLHDYTNPVQLAYHLQLGVSYVVPPNGELDKRRYQLDQKLIPNIDLAKYVPILEKAVQSGELEELPEEILLKVKAMCLLWDKAVSANDINMLNGSVPLSEIQQGRNK